MDKVIYKELINVIEEMMSDNVQLIHAGQIIKWDDTRIPEMIQKIKQNSEFCNKHVVKNITIGNNFN